MSTKTTKTKSSVSNEDENDDNGNLYLFYFIFCKFEIIVLKKDKKPGAKASKIMNEEKTKEKLQLLLPVYMIETFLISSFLNFIIILE